MNWGSGNLLKNRDGCYGEVITTLFGTLQLMSVPYALYAKTAGIDSTMLANMIGSSGGGGNGWRL